jgi:hypothetical protein
MSAHVRRSILLAAGNAVLTVLMAATFALAAGVNLDALAGVYKKTFANGNIDGHKYQSEDILEIVKLSPSTAYIRAHLEFFNGHVCNIAGVAAVEDDALVYRGPVNLEGKPCVLLLKAVNGALRLDDVADACTIGTCGNRGMYRGERFPLNRRRAIRYMDTIKASTDYTDALKDYEAKAPR